MSETRKALCMHCGHEAHYQVGDEGSQAKAWHELLDHDGKCPKNPLVARIEELESQNDALAAVADEHVNTAHRLRDALEAIENLCAVDPRMCGGLIHETAKSALTGGADQTCDHQWVDARNQFIQDGEVCLKCSSVRPGTRP